MIFAMPVTRDVLCSVILLWMVGTHAVDLSLIEPGCADGVRQGLHSFKRIAACSGEWRGHITNADHLCAAGWRVCSHEDRKLLKEITWRDATEFGGCFAFNAAQDGGNCHECRDHLEKDDLAAVGRGCPHQNYGQSSCITGGKIDASCCVDTHFNKSCIYQPGLMSGVLCCHNRTSGNGQIVPTTMTTTITHDPQTTLTPNRDPELLITLTPKQRPRMTLKVSQGVPVFVTCQLTDPVTAEVTWYKDGRLLPGSSQRISILTSGDLFIVPSKVTDSGLYTCTYAMADGRFVSVETELAVEQKHGATSNPLSGCATGVLENLRHQINVRACAGAWLGHIRKGRSLCAKGWHVCSPKDEAALHNISWADIIKTEGCYAFNAANMPSKCSRCRGEYMAGVGKNCGVVRRNSAPSCLPAAHVTVFQKQKSGCYYMPGVTSGVLCCRRKSKRPSHKKANKWIYPECSSGCKNGGRCIATNQCLCPEGFSGQTCQLPVCHPDCSPRGVCVRPGVCKCKKGYIGKACSIRMRHYRCQMPCYNGGKCHRGRCICSKLYWGMSCHHIRWFAIAHWNSTED
ncbi:uncharacterized protein LOC135488959 [Lineus longissimus]|uniref:uncharacterized protein LOC135488959 n=1 Tax=Lineus longissimus TaxID=88925 RepID=UPI002B4E75DA